MTTIGWETIGRSHRRDGYRIDPADGEPPGGWVVTVDETGFALVEDMGVTRFRSLTSAKAAVVHHRLAVIRRTRLLRHLVLTVSAFFSMIPVFALMGPGASTRRVVFFAIGLVLLFVAMRELVGMVTILSSGGWDHGYDIPRLTVVDRLVVGCIDAVGASTRRTPSVADAVDAPVRVVPYD